MLDGVDVTDKLSDDDMESIQSEMDDNPPDGRNEYDD